MLNEGNIFLRIHLSERIIYYRVTDRGRGGAKVIFQELQILLSYYAARVLHCTSQLSDYTESESNDHSI